MTPDKSFDEGAGSRDASPVEAGGSSSPPTGGGAPPPIPSTAGVTVPPLPTVAPGEIPGAPAFEVPLDASGAIDADVACRKCAYNLRGLREEGVCPECGSPVGLSTHGDLIRFADPDWIETLARGLTYILWGILVGMFAGAVGTALAAFVHESVGQIISFAGSLVAFYGAWLLTERDPAAWARIATARRGAPCDSPC